MGPMMVDSLGQPEPHAMSIDVEAIDGVGGLRVAHSGVGGSDEARMCIAFQRVNCCATSAASGVERCIGSQITLQRYYE